MLSLRGFGQCWPSTTNADQGILHSAPLKSGSLHPICNRNRLAQEFRNPNRYVGPRGVMEASMFATILGVRALCAPRTKAIHVLLRFCSKMNLSFECSSRQRPDVQIFK
eukprot:9472749-Pyramimonas_sp.AAC.1